MNSKNLLRLAFLVLALLTGFAAAQIDDRARELIEGLATAEQSSDLQTMDMTMTMFIPDAEGVGDITTTTRSLIDYVGRRAVIISELAEGMSTRMVHIDGQTSMYMSGMNMALPVPPAMAGVFDTMFEPDTYGNMLEQDGVTATYDGEVSYGDLLAGEQVTVTGDFTGMDVPGMTESSVTKMVFGPGGEPLGVVTESDGNTIVMVYDEAWDPSKIVPPNTTMYEFADGSGTLYATMTYENVSVNEPLDETLFE